MWRRSRGHDSFREAIDGRATGEIGRPDESDRGHGQGKGKGIRRRRDLQDENWRVRFDNLASRVRQSAATTGGIYLVPVQPRPEV
jgi:hypothetical protein